MPSPFPGMDPYLEGSLWTTLHFTLGAEIVRQLAPRLRPRYVALPVERFVVEISTNTDLASSSIYPDAAVVPAGSPPVSPGGTVAADAPLQLATVVPEAVPHLSVEIRDAANRRLVTALEILSPANKRGAGRAEYLFKRGRLLRSPAHLVEIDLLRTGRRLPMQQPLPLAPYFVFVGRAEERPMIDVWPVGLAQSLPAVPIPLLPGDEEATLDLQAAFTAAYDLLGYDLLVDYSRPPEVDLTEEERAWLEVHIL